MSAARKPSPTYQRHRGAGRRVAAAGGRSISTLAVLQFCGLLLAAWPSAAQSWNLGGRIADWAPSHTGGRLRLGFEQRVRYESRSDNVFVPDADTFAALERTRVSLTLETGMVKASAMFQDARAPWFGPAAPGNLRDTADLQEAYIELFPKRKKGFGLLAGRIMLNYGEGRLIGSPQWGNTARTYDYGRISYTTASARVEAIFASPVKVRTDSFNTPVLSDRVWGIYSTFRRGSIGGDVYLLRHDNLGGFRVNMLGFRLTGPIAAGWRYSLEGVGQNGRVGPARHLASGWHAAALRRWTVFGRSLDLSTEYNYASGTRDPRDPTRSGTFDQFSPAAHDKFGHEDLFGWKNLHNWKTLITYAAVKGLAVNIMYNQSWLASACDSLYSTAGRSIARSATCRDGRHIGQEFDIYAVYTRKPFQLGAGYGYFIPGQFILRTTPGAGPSLAYIFHTYSF